MRGANIDYIAKASGLSRTSVKDALRAYGVKREQGSRIYQGQIPYGWKLEHGRLVEHKKEQEVIAFMREKREAGQTLRQIADRLNGAGLKTKNQRVWQAATVLKILKSSNNCKS